MTVPQSKNAGDAGHVSDHELIRGELIAAEAVEAEVVAARGGQASLSAAVSGKVPLTRQVATPANQGILGGGALSSDLSLTADPEFIRDTIGAALRSGTYVTATVDDTANTITFEATGLVPATRQITAGTGLTGGGTLAADRSVALDLNYVLDQVIGMMTAGTNIALSKDLVGNTVTISYTGATGGMTLEQVQDAVADMIDQNTVVTAVYDDAAGTVTLGLGTGSVGTAQIADRSVTAAKLPTVATARIRGRVTAGSGDVEDLTGTQATTLLDTFTSALKGLAPASGGGTTNFLRADGTWTAPPSSAPADGSISTAKLADGAVTTLKIAASAVTANEIATDAVTSTELAAGAVGTDELATNVVTNAKLAQVATATIKGRVTASTGDVEDLTQAQARVLINQMILPYSIAGALTVANGTFRWYNKTGRTLTIAGVWASVGVAPASPGVIIDVNKGSTGAATTIFTTQALRPTIANGAFLSNTVVPEVSTVADGDYLTFDVDAIGGSSTPGSDLTITVLLAG